MMRKRVCGNKVQVNRPIWFLIVSMLMMWLYPAVGYGTPVHNLSQEVAPGGAYQLLLPAVDANLPAVFNVSITPITGYIIESMGMAPAAGWSGSFTYTYDPVSSKMAYNHAKIEGTLKRDPPLPQKGSGKSNNKFTVQTTGDPMKVEVGMEPLPHDIDTLAAGRICINAQAEYKKAKWKAIVKPSGTTASVTAVSGGVTVPGGAGLSDGDTFWVEGGTEVGDYEIKIVHNSFATCTDTGGEKVFKFVLEPKDAGFMNPAESSTSLHAHAPAIIKPGVRAYSDSFNPIDFHKRDIDAKSHRESRIATVPLNLYSGRINAKTSLIGSQDGVMTAVGLVGLSASGSSVAISNASLSWRGKLTLSGGGLGSDVVRSDGGKQVTAPQILFGMIWNESIDHNYSIQFNATYDAYVWMKLEGEVAVTGTEGGALGTFGAGYMTRASLISNSNVPLYLLAASVPFFTDYKIVP